jgi:hypothetical protein
MFCPVDNRTDIGDRPRVITYFRKDRGLLPTVVAEPSDRDIIGIQLLNLTIFNVYRDPRSRRVLDIIDTINPVPTSTLFAGDFHAHHDSWESGIEQQNTSGSRLAKWVLDQDLRCITPRHPNTQPRTRY